jgi:hypothetical protein
MYCRIKIKYFKTKLNIIWNSSEKDKGIISETIAQTFASAGLAWFFTLFLHVYPKLMVCA